MKAILLIGFAVFAVIFFVALYVGMKATKGVERVKKTDAQKSLDAARENNSAGPPDLPDL